MLNLWKKTCSEQSTQDVAMSSATNCEPMDSAVRVTAPMPRQNGPSRPSGSSKRPSDEDTDDQRCFSKRPKTVENDEKHDMVVLYIPSMPATDTELCIRIHKMDKNYILTQQFKHARRLLKELGSYAADLLWRKLAENGRVAKVLGPGKLEPTIQTVVESWIFEELNWEYALPNHNINTSPQFTCLVEILQACIASNHDLRGVIIVKRPVVAIIMVELLKKVQASLALLRPCAVLGLSVLNEETHQVLNDFSCGTYNVLVATEDVKSFQLPQLSFIIQYNLLQTPLASLLSQMQPEAHEILIVHMAEHYNDLHKRLLRSYRDPGATKLGSASAADQVLYDSDSDSETDIDVSESIREPTTGRNIQPSHALSTLQSIYDPSQIRFNFQSLVAGQCVAGIEYPIGRPLRLVEGEGQSSVEGAKTSACFRVLHLLFERGRLHISLFPPNVTSHSGQEVSETMKAGQRAKASSTTRCYPRKSPQFWTNTINVFKNRLYPTVVFISPFTNERYAPVLLLTRFWLPDIQNFPVFSSGLSATVHMKRAAPIRLSQSELQNLQRYTLRIARAVINKPFDCTTESMPYFFAPIASTWDPALTDLYMQRFSSVPISWDDVEKAVNQWACPLLPEDGALTDADTQDAIIQDRAVEFTNRYFVVKVRDDMTPLSKPDEGEREAAHPSFLQYCRSRMKDFAGLKNEQQPLVEVAPVPPCINNLSPLSKPTPSTSKYTAKYLIPELCYKFSIPASVFRTALLLPSIMHAVDSALLLKELNWNMFNGDFEEERLHAAMICPTASMQHDYERLELLGDAFLKYAASTYYYVTMPSAREGALHAARQAIISNKALRIGAIEAGLPPYIQSKPIVPKIWKPQILSCDMMDDQVAGQNIPDEKTENIGGPEEEKIRDPPKGIQDEVPVSWSGGKRKRQQQEHAIQWLGDKTVADVVEALLGAMYLDKRENSTLLVAKRLNIPFTAVNSWSEFSNIAPPINSHYQLPPQALQTVQKIIGYQFKHSALLAEALTHTSNQNARSYDRLEFLGDAVLDLLTVEYVFHANPELSPGGLSMLKSAMVSNTTLATICVLSGLYKYLQCSSPDLALAITVFVEKIRHLQETEQKAAEQEARPPGQFWMEVEPPKVLSDVVESVMGATFVDCSFDTSSARLFFDRTLKPFFDRHIRLQTLSDHPNTTLTELFHAAGCQQHDVVKNADGSKVRYGVLVHDTLLASADDPVSNVALRKATMAALDVLSKDPGLLTRICDCRLNKQSKKAQRKKEKVEKTSETSRIVDTQPMEKIASEEIGEADTSMSTVDTE